MEYKSEIGVPAISLASVSYQLAPDSGVSHGWLAAKECLWIYFDLLNIPIPFSNEILHYFIVWNFMNQSLWQNSEYRKVHMWVIVHYFCSFERYITDNVCFACVFLINHQAIHSPIYLKSNKLSFRKFSLQ